MVKQLYKQANYVINTFTRSGTLSAMLKHECVVLGISKTLQKFCTTRFASHHVTLMRLLELRPALEKVVSSSSYPATHEVCMLVKALHKLCVFPIKNQN